MRGRQQRGATNPWQRPPSHFAHLGVTMRGPAVALTPNKCLIHVRVYVCGFVCYHIHTYACACAQRGLTTHQKPSSWRMAVEARCATMSRAQHPLAHRPYRLASPDTSGAKVRVRVRPSARQARHQTGSCMPMHTNEQLV